MFFYTRVQRLFALSCGALLAMAMPLWAVSLRVQTTTGDSSFFAPVGDTVSVSVLVDSEGLALTGVELFLEYDSRLFAAIDTTRSALLLGRVLVDTAFALSDTSVVLHYAEANLVGKSVSGILFAVKFRVVGGVSGASHIGLARGPGSLYTVSSRVADTFPFERVVPLTYGDRPPQLALPWRFEVLEDSSLVVHLQPLAQDGESDAASLVWQVVSPDSLVGIAFDDAHTAVLHPAPDVWGDLQLFFSVSDPSGGTAETQVTLRVWPVNDPPVIAAGALPDTVFLNERNARIVLSAVDIDEDVLAWTGQGTSPVVVSIEDGAIAHIFAPVDWVGNATVALEVSDGAGGRAVHVLTVIRTQALNALIGDFDGDGRVAFPDFLVFAQAFGSEGPQNEADFNGDGRVDFSDFLVFAQHFGRTAG